MFKLERRLFAQLMSNGWTVAVHEVPAGCGGLTDGFVKAGFVVQADDILFDAVMDLRKLG